MRKLEVQELFGIATVQDLGRPGLQHWGIVQGGAADRAAFLEGCAILDQPADRAAIECLGAGGRFGVRDGTLRAVLTGARFKAWLDGSDLEHGVSFRIEPGQTLTISNAAEGNYGYLHVGGGIDVPTILGSRATHLRAGLGGHQGRALRSNDLLPLAADPESETGQTLEMFKNPVPSAIRVVWGVQAHRFSMSTRRDFLERQFPISMQLDRMGVRLDTQGKPIEVEGGRTGISDAVVKGDIQITGDGTPAVLLADHQPTGGYPRIATIVTADQDRFAQMRPGQTVQFERVELDRAHELLIQYRERLEGLRSRRAIKTRQPHDLPNLLEHNLVTALVAEDDL